TQVASNLQAIQNAQLQLQNLADAADRARERRLNFERQIADLEAESIPTPTPQATSGQETLLGESTAQQLQAAQARLTQLLEHKTVDHPDVRAMQRTIRDLQTKLATEEAKRPQAETSVAVLRGLPPAERQRQQRIRDLKIQIDDIDRQLKEKQEEDQRLRG